MDRFDNELTISSVVGIKKIFGFPDASGRQQ